MTGFPRLDGRAALGWLAAAPVAGLAAARLARYDDQALLSMANAGTPFVYLPAYAALAAGVLGRRKALTAVAGAVAVAHILWTAPEVRLRRRRPAVFPGTRVRVVSSNIRFPSTDTAPLGRELATTGADILLLQELSADHLIVIKGTGALDDFPYSYIEPRAGSFGAGIFSRYPLSDAETWEPGGLPMLRATVDIDGTPVRLFNVHVRAPMRRRWIRVFKTQLAALTEAVRDGDGPVLMAGDFNSTYGLEPFRRLLAETGLRDAHVEAGRGLRALTWPRGGRLIPPLFRIDHVLVSDGIDVVDARVGVGGNSDHRPVVADVLVRPSAV